MSRIRHGLLLGLGLAVLAALGQGGSAGAAAAACPTSNAPNTLTLVGGTPQTAKLHQPFDEMLGVTLANTNGCPVTTDEAGVPVTFTAPSSGATGTFSASGSNAVTVGTNASGQASAPGFTANGTAGSYTVTASSDDGTVTFSLTNTASGIAATITAGAPTSQSAIAGSRYSQPLQATVLDANGNPVDGATVTFTLGSGGGGGGAGTAAAAAGATFDGGGSQVTEVTNSSGTAVSPLFAANSDAGAFAATAATAGVLEPADFSLDNLAAKPTTIAALAPKTQSATAGTRYREALQVKVLDGNGSPLQGATVTFALGSAAGGGAGSAGAGASFADGSSQATEATDASGIATSPRFSANTTAGRFTATAATAGTTEVASFSLKNLAGKPPTITRLAPAKQSATVAARYRRPLRVRVGDGSGKPLQGASVTFALGSAAGGGAGTGGSAGAGASFAGGSSQATETTDAAGIATSPRFSADATAGRFTAIATTTGTTNVASFSLDNLAGKPATIIPTRNGMRSATVGRPYAKRLQVKARDAGGTPLQGVSVTFSLGGSGAGGSGTGSASAAGASFVGGTTQASAVTNAAGIATSPRLSADTTAGRFTATATAAGVSGAASFALHNLPGKPATITAGVAATESTAVGTRFPIRLAVTITDKDGNPVAGVTVSFSAPAGGASGHFGATRRTVRVRTDAKGVAVAPPFLANGTQGGYVVRARAAGHAAAFALVNQPAG